ncbi:MAG: FAD-dependent oxidoreductase [Aerococcus sp.]|nr:FAD-dependent oxidoreductase [Aerococcus sp.]
MSRNIVVVGAGFSGVSATKKLAKKFKREKDTKITLIDRHSYLTYMTELHEVAGGRVEPTDIQYDLRHLFARQKNVDLVTDEVQNIDYERQVVKGEYGEYPYDYLLISAGAEPNDFGVPGVKEYGATMWSIEEAEVVRHRILEAFTRAAHENDKDMRRRMLNFVVCGAGFTGVELIGELIDWMPILAKQHKIDIDEVSLNLVEAGPVILPPMVEKDQNRALKFIQKKGVHVYLGDAVKEVFADHVLLSSGKEIPTYNLIWTAGIQANTGVDWQMESARAHRLKVNKYMQSLAHKNVFASGDIAYYEEEDKDGKPYPQIVQAAEQTAETAALNIYHDASNEEMEAYKGKYDGHMVSLGGHYGVARIFDKLSMSGFFALAVKHLINIMFFLTNGSLYYSWRYILTEFLHIRHHRNLMGRFFSSYGNLLWLLPLRIYYGGMWFTEGLKKCFGLFGGESWFGSNIIFPFDWLQGDAVAGASASGAAEETAKQIFGLNYVTGEEPMLVFQNMPGWFEWIMKILLPNQEVAMFMQRFMAIFELFIGLMLIIGLFTWIFSGITIILVSMFCLSGMFVWPNMWFIPAALALMAGGGRVLGVDGWLLPRLGHALDNWWYGTPRSIYRKE